MKRFRFRLELEESRKENRRKDCFFLVIDEVISYSFFSFSFRLFIFKKNVVSLRMQRKVRRIFLSF